MNDQPSVASFFKEATSTDPKKKSDHYELGIVPEEWKVVDLVEMAKIEMGSSPKSKFYNKDGSGLPFFQGNNEFGRRYPDIEVWCSEPVKVAERDDILISVRAPVGDLNIAKKKSCIGRGLAAISSGKFNMEYLFYHLKERNKWLNRISAGSTYDSINSSQLKNLKLRYPPISEQRRIASVLYNVDQAIQKTEEIIEQTQRVKKGMMQDLFTEGYYDHEEYEEDTFGSYPSDWNIKKLSQILLKGPQNGLYKSSDHYGQGTSIVELSDIYRVDKVLSNKHFRHLELDQSEKEKYGLEKDDIIVNRVSKQVSGVGKTLRVDFSEDAVFESNMMRMRLNDEIRTRFFLYITRSTRYRKYISAVAKHSNQASIDQSALESLPIPIPELEEQDKICEVLDSLDYKEKNLEKGKEQFQQIKKGLMQDLLTGKVRTKNKDIEVLPDVLEVEE